MSDLNLNNCVVYNDKVYCVKEDGTAAVFQIKEIEPDNFPPCVVEALYKKLLEKNKKL
jgi:hypothetical protein